MNIFEFFQRLNLSDELCNTPLDKPICFSIICTSIIYYRQVNPFFRSLIFVSIHGVSLAGTCLTVAKYGGVKSIDNIFDHIVDLGPIVNIFLNCFRAKNFVEAKLLSAVCCATCVWINARNEKIDLNVKIMLKTYSILLA